MKLAAKELRASEPTKGQLAKIKRRDIYIICDNVLDTYNIGSIFRLADAVGVKCVYLCGETETPPNPRVAKASVGTDKWVEWQYRASAVEAIEELKRKFSTSSNNKQSLMSSLRSNNKDAVHVIPAKAGIQKLAESWIPNRVRDDKRKNVKVIAIEQAKGSVDFREANYSQPIAFVVGHETDGVSRRVLDVVDEIVEIPMFGVNVSLNVMVSLAIVLYRAI